MLSVAEIYVIIVTSSSIVPRSISGSISEERSNRVAKVSKRGVVKEEQGRTVAVFQKEPHCSVTFVSYVGDGAVRPQNAEVHLK